MARKLRIAVSVFFGFAALTFLLLWPVTHLRPISIAFPGAKKWEQREFHIREGRIGFGVINNNPMYGRSIRTTHFPLWFCTALALFFAWGFWAPHPPLRFSLRTLLIATTLLAVVLGLGVWLAR